MLWRDDPRADAKPFAGGRPSWPKNGAVLKGVVHTLKGRRYLEVGGHLLHIVPALVIGKGRNFLDRKLDSQPVATQRRLLFLCGVYKHIVLNLWGNQTHVKYIVIVKQHTKLYVIVGQATMISHCLVLIGQITSKE